MSRVTLQSIATQVGVSRMTVSNAFSRPDQLSDALRMRILAVADELGYLGPDPAARSLATGTTGSIGVLWSARLREALSDEITARFLGAIADELAPDGLALTLVPATVDGPVVPARDVAMDGAIAYSCDPASPALAWLERRTLPVVYVDMPAPPGSPSIRIDDAGGARAAAQHLVDLGHRRIALLTVQVDRVGSSHVVEQRMRGWLQALTAAGIQPDVLALPSSVGARRLVAQLLREVRPTAVLCLTAVLAHDVLAAADDLGLAVPDDLSVVGFDDHPLALRTRPSLTTVRQDVDAKGHAAARALLSAIAAAGSESVSVESHLLPVTLVVRESSGPPPAS
ncbi:MAG: LacI family DNA-binding transcriptional regulator [Micropruina sp.]